MDLRINRCRKFITWNVISAIGYIGVIFGIIFSVMFVLASSGIGIRADISEYFLTYTIKHVISPYLELYKFQLLLVGVMLLASVYENSYYVHKGEYGLRLFANSEKLYSILFVTGVCLNLLPMYVFFMSLMSNLTKIL